MSVMRVTDSHRNSPVFVSHSQYNNTLLPFFNSIFASVGVQAHLVEIAQPVNPQLTIEDMMHKSIAMFLLLSQEVTRSEYTKNWISTEIGLAKGAILPILVFEEYGKPVDFPLTYCDVYSVIITGNKSPNLSALRDLIIHGEYRGQMNELEPVLCPNCSQTFRTLSHFDDIHKCPLCLAQIKMSPYKIPTKLESPDFPTGPP